MFAQAYEAAIARVIRKKKAAGDGAHVIDMGTGAGALALMAAKTGADSVVACDLHETMCNVARKVSTHACIVCCEPHPTSPTSLPTTAAANMLPEANALTCDVMSTLMCKMCLYASAIVHQCVRSLCSVNSTC